jgi:hypothetical protein
VDRYILEDALLTSWEATSFVGLKEGASIRCEEGKNDAKKVGRKEIVVSYGRIVVDTRKKERSWLKKKKERTEGEKCGSGRTDLWMRGQR